MRVDTHEHRRARVEQQASQPARSGQLDESDRPPVHELCEVDHVRRSVRRRDVELSEHSLAPLQRFRVGLQD